jgi:hypothetical protein
MKYQELKLKLALFVQEGDTVSLGEFDVSLSADDIMKIQFNGHKIFFLSFGCVCVFVYTMHGHACVSVHVLLRSYRVSLFVHLYVCPSVCVLICELMVRKHPLDTFTYPPELASLRLFVFLLEYLSMFVYILI